MLLKLDVNDVVCETGDVIRNLPNYSLAFNLITINTLVQWSIRSDQTERNEKVTEVWKTRDYNRIRINRLCRLH